MTCPSGPETFAGFTTRRTQNDKAHTIIGGGKTLLRRNSDVRTMKVGRFLVFTLRRLGFEKCFLRLFYIIVAETDQCCTGVHKVTAPTKTFQRNHNIYYFFLPGERVSHHRDSTPSYSYCAVTSRPTLAQISHVPSAEGTTP